MEMFQSSFRVGVVQPTGTGKSFLFLKWIEDHPGDRFAVLSPSHEIFTQLAEYAAASGCPDLLKNVQFISYQALLQMTDDDVQAIRTDKIILDEFHRTGAEQWGPSLLRLLNANQDAQVLGTSATPVRYLDNCRDMASELFDCNLAVEMTLGEAVRRNILPSPVYVPVWYDLTGKISQYEKDISQVKNSKNRQELVELLKRVKRQLEKSYGAAEIFKKHMPTNHGKYIVFCSDREHLDEMKEKLPRWLAGVNTNIRRYVSISALEDKDIQLQAFKTDNGSDALKLLFTIDRLNEGVHVKGIDGVIMLRPTTSPIIYLQQMGRALASGGNHPLIFDFVNNYSAVSVAYPTGDMRNIFEVEYRESGNSKEIEAFHIYEDMVTFTSIFTTLEASLYPSSDAIWERNFACCLSYKEEYGKWPSRGVQYQGVDIGSWLTRQKQSYQNGTLLKEREQQLNDAGIKLERKLPMWHDGLALCIAYKKEYGNWPSQKVQYQGVNIGSWLTRQKQSYQNGTLLKEREQQLNDAGIYLGDQNDLNWQNKLALCIAYKKEYGNWPSRGVQYQGVNIGLWLNNQKRFHRAGTLLNEREQKLIDARVLFANDFDLNWQNKLALCIAYKKEYGKWPSRGVQYQGVNIGSWLNNQKRSYRAGTLLNEREQELLAVGIKLVPKS